MLSSATSVVLPGTATEIKTVYPHGSRDDQARTVNYLHFLFSNMPNLVHLEIPTAWHSMLMFESSVIRQGMKNHLQALQAVTLHLKQYAFEPLLELFTENMMETVLPSLQYLKVYVECSNYMADDEKWRSHSDSHWHKLLYLLAIQGSLEKVVVVVSEETRIPEEVLGNEKVLVLLRGDAEITSHDEKYITE